MKLIMLKILFVFTTTHITTTARLMDNTEGKNPFLESLTPKKIGDFHNRVMESVDQRMRNDLPTNYESFNSIVEEETIKFSCLMEDKECHGLVRRTLKESDKRVRRNHGTTIRKDSLADFDLEEVLPEILPEHTREAFLSIHDELSKMKDRESAEENADIVVSSIEEIMDNIEADDDLDTGSKTAVISAASVAIGSTKYWTKSHHDKENSFRRLREHSAKYIENEVQQTREMKGVFARVVNIFDIIMSDFIGAVIGSVDPLIDFILSFGVASPTPILFGSFLTAVGDSLSATGIVIPVASEIVRCFLEDFLLPTKNCSIYELFCGDTDIC